MTPDLGIGLTIISAKDGMTLLSVPAGEFKMGSETYNGEKPFHKVNLDAFWIDRTEVTNKMYALCVDASDCQDQTDFTLRSAARYLYYGNHDFDNYPVIYTTWDDAKAYCEWAGRRMPIEAEWEKAARGENAFTYPWGNQFDGSLVNFCDKNCSFDGADKNSFEWVADWYSETYYASSRDSNPLGPDSGQYPVVRGGAWSDSYTNVRSAGRSGLDPANSGPSGGFRCVMSATP